MSLQIPQRGRARYYQFTADKKRDFLYNLERLGSVDLACEVIRVRRQRVDDARRDDPEFRAAWADAVARAFSMRVNGVAVRGAS